MLSQQKRDKPKSPNFRRTPVEKRFGVFENQAKKSIDRQLGGRWAFNEDAYIKLIINRLTQLASPSYVP